MNSEQRIDKWTDKELERLEKRIEREYKQAEKEIAEKSRAYMAQFKARYEKEKKAYEAGKYTKDEFQRWYYSQIGRGEHWNELKNQMAQRVTESSAIASGYINGLLPKVYANNSNAIASIATDAMMEQGVAGISFELVDEYTVKRLMESSSEVKPYKKVSISLDESTRYSKNKLQNALLQGVLQGDSIDKIANRFMLAVGMIEKSAIRNARTAVTGARSAGKQDRYDDLASKGCEITKVWVATNDGRTRPEHAEADGQEVPKDEPFDVGGEELMYPADPNGSGWNIYNCRCTMCTGEIKFKSVLSDDARQKANIRVKV